MITLITGAPGSGKSAALVQLLSAIAKGGRVIYVDGIPDLTVKHEVIDDPKKWHLPVDQGGIPDGSAIVLDEVQRVWRPRGSGSKVPPEVAALETHRHRGLDFFIVTQHPNLLDQNVRRLVGRHIHLRDLGILGRWWYEWPESSNPEQWKGAPIKKRYTLPKQVFGLYKSASLHVKPIRSIPRSLIVVCLCIPLLGLVSWRAYSRVVDRISSAAPPTVASASSPASVDHPSPDASFSGGGGPTASGRNDVPPGGGVQPHGSNGVAEAKPSLVGCISMGARCECIDSTGHSIDVELKACLRDATRTGVGVAYPMEQTRGQGRSVAVADRVDRGGQAYLDAIPDMAPPPPSWGFNAGEVRSSLRAAQ